MTKWLRARISPSFYLIKIKHEVVWVCVSFLRGVLENCIKHILKPHLKLLNQDGSLIKLY